MNLSEAGLKMGIESLAQIIRHLEVRFRQAEEDLARAQADVDTFGKLVAFARQYHGEMLKRLWELKESRQ